MTNISARYSTANYIRYCYLNLAKAKPAAAPPRYMYVGDWSSKLARNEDACNVCGISCLDGMASHGRGATVRCGLPTVLT